MPTIYTVNSLSEQVIRIFNESRPTVEEHLDVREVGKQVRAIGSEMIGERWYKVRQAQEVKYLGGLFMATFTGVTVQKDNDTDECYITLPAIPEDLMDGTGLQGILPEGKASEDSTAKPMIPLPPNSDMVLNQLPVGALQGRFGFRQHRDIVLFTEVKDGKNLLDEKIKTVEVRMITVGPEGVADDQPFPMPHDMFPELLRRVLTIFGVEQQKQADLVNDQQ